MSVTANEMRDQLSLPNWRLRLRPRLLLVLVVASALAVIYTKHWNRKLFAEIQTLQSQRDQLNIEWGQLQLEQSAWATHVRIEAVARERLEMAHPAPEKVVVIRP